MNTLWFAAPGKLDQPTGGFVYDRRICDYLRSTGMELHYRELDPSFPEPDANALDDARSFLTNLPDGTIVVIDGLAFGAMPDIARDQAERLQIVALVHHPLGDETGHAPDKREQLLQQEAAALQAARLVIVTSPFTRERLSELGVSNGAIEVVEPGVDPRPIAQGSESDTLHLLCVASYTRRKGHVVLFDALEHCLDLDWHLVAIGAEGLDLDYQTEVRRRAAWFEDRIELRGPGSRGTIDELLSAADIFILPSLYEGYGMVLSEALAAGLPIVSTTGGAIPFTVPQSAGLLVPPGNALALKDALREVMSDPDVRQALRRGAIDAREHQMRWDEAGSRFLSVLQDRLT